MLRVDPYGRLKMKVTVFKQFECPRIKAQNQKQTVMGGKF